MRPLISIVVVNSDGAADTLRCLESIFRNPPDAAARRLSAEEDMEVILVDNCSRDGCLEAVRCRFPRVVALEAPERQGFAKNYNLGLRHARGEHVLVLNNDTLVPPGALSRLLAAMAANPSYGMAGPRLVGASGAVQVDCARPLPSLRSYLLDQLLLDQGLPLGRLWARWRSRRLERRPSGPVPCIGGACMLVRRAALEQAGPLDEDFVFYYEDVEWCHRLGRAGWLVGYVAESTITHLGDRSLSKVKIWAKRSEYRSAIRYFRLYHGLGIGGERLLRAATGLSWLLRGVLFLLAEAYAGRESHARPYLLLWQWLLRGDSQEV